MSYVYFHTNLNKYFILLYQLLTMDFNLTTTVIELRKIVAFLIMISAYSTTYFQLDCEHISDEMELFIVEKYTKKTKTYAYAVIVLFSIYFISITSSCILNVLLYLFGTLDNNQLTLPFPINNFSNSGPLYYFLLIYQTGAFYIVLIIGCVVFISYLVVIQHACCLFSIIILKIQQQFTNDSKYLQRSSFSQRPCQEFHWIVDLIKRYRHVTEYVDLINYFSNVIYLIVVFLGMTIVVIDLLCIFQISIVLQNASKIIEFTIYVMGSIFTTYINFYIGQEILNYSNAVFEELCQIPFYLLPIKTQKILLFMIARSMKPCMLSIGGLFVSSHEVFSQTNFLFLYDMIGIESLFGDSLKRIHGQVMGIQVKK
ncbi:uncharacterized protein LOC118448606 [Vespa mandarinia]|uniref:uncharacterized protein LOC118448606 n=1 Tax=Vespa mandarinia TaxID=7446 RepID=UPI001617D73A|nr:uncharacterized protein LOC118448606 [Vespa mandarinia]